MSAESIDTVVIGAGVVGLAVARALAMAGQEVVLLEAENAFGTVTSALDPRILQLAMKFSF